MVSWTKPHLSPLLITSGKNMDGRLSENPYSTCFTYLIHNVLIMGSALLWHKLMGEVVLAVGNDTAPHLRTYAHCSKGRVSLNVDI